MSGGTHRSAAEAIRDDKLSYEVIGCAINVHRKLGCGLLESAYEACLAFELVRHGFAVVRQAGLPVIYEGIRIDVGYKPDLIVNNSLLIELKTVAQVLPIHRSQVLTYLQLTGIETGLLMNFNTEQLANGGIVRIVRARTPA